MTPAIQSAAASLAVEQTRASRASAALAAAISARDDIQNRMKSLQAERAAIIAARSGGAVDPEHGARLALLDADMEGLKPIFAEKNAAADAAQAVSSEAQRSVDMAQVFIDQVADTELLSQLLTHATKLDELLVATLADIDGLAKRLGKSRPQWAPSRAMADAVRKLDLVAALMAR